MNEIPKSRKGYLKVTEIFHSLQGEALQSGLPTVFVRLTGCPLRCTYCDSEYAFFGGELMHFDEILAELPRHGTPHVCVTAGDPLAPHETYNGRQIHLKGIVRDADPVEFEWNFGDGNTAAVQSPSHTYAAAGSYDVTLTVTNAQGSDTATRVDYITVTERGGHCGFMQSPRMISWAERQMAAIFDRVVEP